MTGNTRPKFASQTPTQGTTTTPRTARPPKPPVDGGFPQEGSVVHIPDEPSATHRLFSRFDGPLKLLRSAITGPEKPPSDMIWLSDDRNIPLTSVEVVKEDSDAPQEATSKRTKSASQIFRAESFGLEAGIRK